MNVPVAIDSALGRRQFLARDWFLLGMSVLLQLVLALLFGHLYDIRIFMATGYLVGTGQNPYVAQDLSTIFNPSFRGITTVGYPPPWSLVLGLVYLLTYNNVPNLLLYNIAIKAPIIAANICLAFLVARVLSRLGADESISRKAWIFLLFNPFLLYASSAWGQFDSVVAVLALLALVLLWKERLAGSAVLLALAISFKPTALALIPVAFVYFRGRPFPAALRFFTIFWVSALLLFVGPFVVLRWDPTPILQNWNAHFVVGGGLSFMTFMELLQNSYELPDLWWLVGWVWAPALGIATYALKPGKGGLLDLLKNSAALVMVFFLSRAWLSEPNIILVLPLVLILTSMGELRPLALTAVWALPLVFSLFNTSLAQLLFPSMPDIMNRLLQAADGFRAAGITLRTIVVIPWLFAGWWIVRSCLREHRVPVRGLSPDPWK